MRMHAMTDLAERLKNATEEAHQAVERTPFIQSLLRGTAGREAYVRMLAALSAVYAALERGLGDHRSDPHLAWIDVDALRRSPALARDIAALAPDGAPEPVASARAYAAHLHAIADAAPALLIAHAYTRYLGDLAGGQVLRRTVGRSLDLSEGPGLEFYAFPGDHGALRRAFKDGLASAPVDERQAAAIVEEGRLAFAWHAKIFGELLG